MIKHMFVVTPREEILRDYPIGRSEAPGRYFRIDEASNWVWPVEGCDAYRYRQRSRMRRVRKGV